MFVSVQRARSSLFYRLTNEKWLRNLEPNKNSVNTITSVRQMSSLPNPRGSDKNEPENDRRSLPQLMSSNEILWPSTILSLKNWFTAQFIIRPYFDNEFYIKDFIFGAKRALQVVSKRLANGDFNALENLVTTDVLSKIKPVVEKFSIAQRQLLQIEENDIYLSFPYQIGIVFDESNEKMQRRWVEITFICHSLRGLTEMRQRGEQIPWNMGTLPEYQAKIFVCNYRFIKEFTDGNHSDWTINALNHFKPIDLLKDD